MKRSLQITSLILGGLVSVGALATAIFVKPQDNNKVNRYGTHVYQTLTKNDPGLNIKAESFSFGDTYYGTQKTRSLNNVGNIESVWNDEYKGQDIRLAIIDTGIDYLHEDFYDNPNDFTTCHISSDSAYFERNGLNIVSTVVGPRTSMVQDSYNVLLHDWAQIDGQYKYDSHGTSVAGTAAAAMNGQGTIGIAPDAEIIAIKTDMNLASIRAAINYCVELGDIDVINMSLGAYAETWWDSHGDKHTGNSDVATYFQDAINYAHEAGIIVVAAAGNDATDYDTYPAANEHVIGVGSLAMNSGTTPATFTNFNGNSDKASDNHNVDVVAPGYVYAPDMKGTQNSPTHNGYSDVDGTSFSAPIVAGAACLYKSMYPLATPDEFEGYLFETCIDIGKKGWDNSSGYGAIDIGALMNANPNKPKTADSYAQMFVDDMTCDNGVTIPSTSTWSTLAHEYKKLPTKEKPLLKNATYTISGSTVTPTGTTTQIVAEAIARYSYIIEKYGDTDYENFIDRTFSSASNKLGSVVQSNNVFLFILCGISLISFGFIGYHIVKKR